MWVCGCARARVRVHAHMYLHYTRCVCTHVHMCVCVCTHVHMCVCVYTQVTAVPRLSGSPPPRASCLSSLCVCVCACVCVYTQVISTHKPYGSPPPKASCHSSKPYGSSSTHSAHSCSSRHHCCLCMRETQTLWKPQTYRSVCLLALPHATFAARSLVCLQVAT